jgi:hypothetical protein
MTPANRPITSREYKLLLNTERFRDRIAGARLFWRMLDFLVRNQDNQVIPDSADPEKDKVERRTTWYLDTPGYELQRANVTLRVRDELEAKVEGKKRYKVTLKYRAPDRYTAAGCDPTPDPDRVKKHDIKFEEDVTPPFISKFSYSASFRTDELPRIEKVQDAVELFPGLAHYGIHEKAPIQLVNGFRAHEVLHYIGKLKLDKMPATRALELPDFVVKVALSHWYLLENEDDYPLVTEFAFGFEATEGDDKDDDRLEKFPPTVVAGANRLFRDVQNQAGWLSPFGMTKTAYLFEVL